MLCSGFLKASLPGNARFGNFCALEVITQIEHSFKRKDENWSGHSEKSEKSRIWCELSEISAFESFALTFITLLWPRPICPWCKSLARPQVLMPEPQKTGTKTQESMKCGRFNDTHMASDVEQVQILHIERMVFSTIARDDTLLFVIMHDSPVSLPSIFKQCDFGFRYVQKCFSVETSERCQNRRLRISRSSASSAGEKLCWRLPGPS